MQKLRVIVMTQNDRFFIPRNIHLASKVCEIVEIVEVDCRSSLDNKLADYLKWFGFRQCAKMGVVTIMKEIEKYTDRLSGYKLCHGFCSIKDVAKADGIPYKVVQDSNAPEFVSHVKEIAPDLIISYSAPQVMKEELLNTPRCGAINVHGSLLPDFRGCLPSFWYLYEGEKVGGATVHYMSAKIDDGDIIEQETLDISGCRTMFDVISRTKTLGGKLMVKAIGDITAGMDRRRRNEVEKGRYFTWPTPGQAKEFRDKGYKLI